jgi:simple sugar transport system permease protein
MDKERKKRLINSLSVTLLAIISGLIVAAILVFLSGKSPLEAYRVLFESGFSCESLDRCTFVTTLERATPLILTGLSALVAFRTGVFSLGQEGQMMLGAVMAAWLGWQLQLPQVIHPLVVMIAAVVVGGLYGFIPGLLKVKLGVNELITTIMLNEIAVLFLEWVVNFPLRADAGAAAHSFPIQESAWLPSFLPKSRWGVGFVIAILMAVLIYFLLWRTAMGYEQRMSGNAPRFAKYGGIQNEKAALRGMIISGALAGLAGAIEVLGVNHRIMTGYSVGLGFDGVSVAILGQTHPLGVVIVAILFAGVRLGAQLGLQIQLRVPRELGGVIIAFIILFVATDRFFLNGINWVRGKLSKISGKKAVKEGSD